MKARREISAGLLVARKARGRMFFLALRSTHGDGYWGFAKGKLKQGETPLQAALRELREETGIGDVFVVPGTRDTYRYSFARGKGCVAKRVTMYLAVTRASRVRLSREHSAYRWLSETGMLRALTYPSARALFLRCMRKMRKHGTLRAAQEAVYRSLVRVPEGKVTTYGALACAGKVSPRAAGRLVSFNYDTAIPCHRVVYADGRLGGYNRGEKTKEALLGKEGVVLVKKKGRVVVSSACIV